ncbi:MAG: hypothetical protein KKI02_03795, partial [Planctomycetes bacterium]|nr:hypothetical protein [Planctomycetota bacterium]
MRFTNPIRTRATCMLIAASVCITSISSCGLEEDYQRDILVSVGGGLAGAILTNTVLGPDDSDAAVRSVPGPQGPQGPPGPSFFNVFVDKFYGAQFDDGFQIVPVPNDAPFLGADAGPVAYRVLVPSTVGAESATTSATAQSSNALRPITMRLYLNRSGACSGGCLVFTVDARRLRDGNDVPQCYGGSLSDCSDGTRWVMVDSLCLDGADTAELLYAVDLPLTAGGLEFPQVAAGDYLAFELNTLTDDGGIHRLLGVEFFDSTTAELANAVVLFSEDSIPDECEPIERPTPGPDCNNNGVPDAIDIAEGTSEDCNNNSVPDECDIADGTSEDCNNNDIPDECDIADGTSSDVNGNGVPDEC